MIRSAAGRVLTRLANLVHRLGEPRARGVVRRGGRAARGAARRTGARRRVQPTRPGATRSPTTTARRSRRPTGRVRSPRSSGYRSRHSRSRCAACRAATWAMPTGSTTYARRSTRARAGPGTRDRGDPRQPRRADLVLRGPTGCTRRDQGGDRLLRTARHRRDGLADHVRQSRVTWPSSGRPSRRSPRPDRSPIGSRPPATCPGFSRVRFSLAARRDAATHSMLPTPSSYSPPPARSGFPRSSRPRSPPPLNSVSRKGIPSRPGLS